MKVARTGIAARFSERNAHKVSKKRFAEQCESRQLTHELRFRERDALVGVQLLALPVHQVDQRLQRACFLCG